MIQYEYRSSETQYLYIFEFDFPYNKEVVSERDQTVLKIHSGPGICVYSESEKGARALYLGLFGKEAGKLLERRRS